MKNLYYLPKRLWLFLGVFLIILIVNDIASAQSQCTTATSANGRFTVTKCANQTTIAPGGVIVNYTYEIKNISSSNLYYVSSSDNKIAGLTYNGGFTNTPCLLNNYTTLAPGASATFSGSANITQTTTNTFTATFGTGLPLLCLGQPTGQSSASTNITVTVQVPAGALSCNTIYFSSDVVGAKDGRVGTIIVPQLLLHPCTM